MNEQPNQAGPRCRLCGSTLDEAQAPAPRANDDRELSEVERTLARQVAEGVAKVRHVDEEFTRTATRSQRLADAVARVGGSWPFVTGALVVVLAWILLNAVLLGRAAFDPYPFILLNLALSCVAALQAPIIMMSQNRTAKRDRAQADQDYLTNLKSEAEVEGLHAKLDLVLQARWRELLELQQRQIELLTALQRDATKR